MSAPVLRPGALLRGCALHSSMLPSRSQVHTLTVRVPVLLCMGKSPSVITTGTRYMLCWRRLQLARRVRMLAVLSEGGKVQVRAAKAQINICINRLGIAVSQSVKDQVEKQSCHGSSPNADKGSLLIVREVPGYTKSTTEVPLSNVPIQEMLKQSPYHLGGLLAFTHMQLVKALATSS